jgi:branched-chain amino acid transport system substrate-binding protein
VGGGLASRGLDQWYCARYVRLSWAQTKPVFLESDLNQIKTFVVAAVLALSTFAGGINAATIKVGAVLPLSGLQAQSGKDIQAYLEASAAWVNASGVSGAHRIEMVIVDDGYDPKRSTASTATLIKDGVSLMMNTVGTANITAMTPVLKEAGVGLWAPSSGPQSIYAASQQGVLIPFRASYHDEIKEQAARLRASGVTSVAVVYQDDGFGADYLTGWKNAVSEIQGLVIASTHPVQRGAADIAEPMRGALQSRDSAVVLGLVAAPAMQAVRQFAASPNGVGRFITLLSITANSENIDEVRKLDARGVMFSSVVPSPSKSPRTSYVREFNELVTKNKLKPSLRGFETYLAVRALAEVLRKQPANVTSSSLAKALANAREVSFSGETWSLGSRRFVDVIYVGKYGLY